MTPSKILLYFCLSFVGGIFFSSLLPDLSGREVYFLLAGSIAGLILISVFWKYKKPVVIGFCVLFLVFGMWRQEQFEIRSAKSEIRNLNDGRVVILSGVVAEEPDVRGKSQKLAVKSKGAKILVTASRYPEYKYGDKLEIAGKPETPSDDIEGFNYRDYLKKDGIYSVMNFPEIELTGSGFGNPIMDVLFSFKNKFKETSQRFIPPPQLGLLEALVFGDESEISKEWKEKFNLTGTRHIAAVSGMNITIISGLILDFLLLLGMWRKHAFYLSVALIILYILMIGAPSSAVRAGVMAGLFLTAQHFGRVSAASRAIVFASTFMLFLNPLLLRLDIGFQLSFLAMLGIVYLRPVFSLWMKKIPNFKFFPLRATIATTLSAQVFTWPILLFNFGYISLISLFANILIVPFLAPITVLIFIFGILGMIFPFFGLVLSFPVQFSLSYVINVVDAFSKASFASLKIENLSWAWLAISYSVLLFAVKRLQRFTQPAFLR